MRRMGFTMLELVFVIIVLGILASLAIPRLDRDLRQEAADDILSSIRYTQLLALTDNKHKFDRTDWQKALWQIDFSQSSGNWNYTIATNMDYGTNLEQNESAMDPSTGQLFYNKSLTSKYGIDTITFNGCSGNTVSAATHVAFDNLGRPHRGVTLDGSNTYETYINNGICLITFSSSSFSFAIQIRQETGYANIVGQNNS